MAALALREPQDERRRVWWARLDSNQQPTGYEPGALPLSYGPAGTQFITAF